MASETAEPRHKGRGSKKHHGQASRTRKRTSDAATAGNKVEFRCPACGDTTNYAPRPHSGYYVGGTFRATGCPGGAECLRRIAEVVGCTPPDLIEDAPRWLAEFAIGSTVSHGYVAALPSERQLLDYRRTLAVSEDVRRWLHGRGLTIRTARRLGFGSDGANLIVPIRDERGEVRNLLRRSIRAGGGYRGFAGRGKTNGGIQLYPYPVPGGDRLIIVAGLLDAPLARQHGLPAITSSHGCGTWLPEWDAHVRGRDVAVCFDVGEWGIARARALSLKAAGASRVRVVDLRELGLCKKGSDLTDAFRQGADAHMIAELVDASREVRRGRLVRPGRKAAR